ncbi:hypothetical protein EV127DRAFT_462591 [Xylaria flabelliformis]|nr:hypothetical protein EV127DRAFT_462591 [Xylaria flabelliformis]
MNPNIAYEPLYGCREDEAADSQADVSIVPPQQTQQKRWLSIRRLTILSLLAATLAACISISSFFLGRHVERQSIESDWFSPPGRIDHTFHYRHQFGMRPGNVSQKYWDLVFPRGRGFIQHPVISPIPHGLAVYHQLHCLDAIRHGYWAARDGIEPGKKAEPGHIRHCIDYLRQSIMCNADTNLEPINDDLGGVTGFGFPRKCRDIVQIMGWADKWRTHNQTDHS